MWVGEAQQQACRAPPPSQLLGHRSQETTQRPWGPECKGPHSARRVPTVHVVRVGQGILVVGPLARAGAELGLLEPLPGRDPSPCVLASVDPCPLSPWLP